MRKRIVAGLDAASLDRAVQEIAAYEAELNRKLISAFYVLAEEAADVVREHFFGYAVTVTTEPVNVVHPNTYRYRIMASGDEVGFLEFGAGTTANSPNNPLAVNAPFPVGPAEYSKRNAQRFYLYGYWYYRKRRYEFVLPRRGLYFGDQYVRQNVRDVVKRSMR